MEITNLVYQTGTPKRLQTLEYRAENQSNLMTDGYKVKKTLSEIGLTARALATTGGSENAFTGE